MLAACLKGETPACRFETIHSSSENGFVHKVLKEKRLLAGLKHNIYISFLCFVGVLKEKRLLAGLKLETLTYSQYTSTS